MTLLLPFSAEPVPSLQKKHALRINTFPAEITNNIASHLDDPRDVLAFASSCSEIYTNLMPHQIRAQVIACDMRRSTVWTMLEESSEVALNYKTLNVFREWPDSNYVLPLDNLDADYNVAEEIAGYWSGDVETQVEYEETMREALKKMKNLSNIRWEMPEPPQRRLLNALRFNSWNLTSLSFELSHAYNDKTYLDFFQFISHSCRNLKSFSMNLRLGAQDVPVSAFLTKAYWPRLERLTLRTPSCPGFALDHFLQRHRHILYLELERFLDVCYPIGLQELYVWDSVALGVQPAKRLYILALYVHLSSSFDIGPPPYVEYLQYATRLERLVINSEVALQTLIQLTEYTPHLLKLHAIIKLHNNVGTLREVKQLCTNLPRLTHLGYITLINEDPEDATDIVVDIAEAFQKLMFIRVAPSPPCGNMRTAQNGDWYTVVRDVRGHVKRYSKTEDTLCGVACRQWGKIPWGAM
ncbi:hypothetical protein PLEOSDRAFT_154350 [Pleurotus ostreatus PC15]|uniref:F-box domain-containing protein n=1 Tax=Pleurotus ostreatus (strain PC15) TaxID=1137138 RepID=A0A067NVP8_PLEO1|nr:hypothetical protein PLEOSDRAFT_154350 [Pleurotus ostreatus PC15]